MTTDIRRPISEELLARYRNLGFTYPIPVLSHVEARRFRTKVEETRCELGGRVTRFDGAHHFFRWAWDLAAHPRLLDCLEQFLGPNILLKSTRVFYKPGNSSAFVGWHQDGYTEQEQGAHVPTIWLGLTAATLENGCLRVVPGSHRLGLVPHPELPDPNNLTSAGTTAQAQIDAPHALVMNAGEMSIHHPLMLHASDPNTTAEPRIGFSASYATPALKSSLTEVAWMRGVGVGQAANLKMVEQPPEASLEKAAAAYRARFGHRIHYAAPID